LTFIFGLFLAAVLSAIAEKALTGVAYRKWQELIPIYSWSLYKYRVIELVFAISLVLAAKWYSGNQIIWIALGLSAAWLSVLTDSYHGVIYDLFTLPFAVAFLIISFFAGDLTLSATGAAFGFIFSALLAKTNKMGQGDVTLLLFYGAWLGLYGLVRALCFGSIATGVILLILLITKKINMKSQLPFAPVMFLGAVLHLWV